MLTRYFAALLCAVASNVAHADTTAVYKSGPKGFELSMTVELSDDGDARYQTSMGNTYGVIRNGVDYFVEMRSNGPVVDRVSDMMTVQREVWLKLTGDLPQSSKSDSTLLTQLMKLVPLGKTTIRGREGRAYTDAARAARKNMQPLVVISDDPDLQPLGRFMASQFSESLVQMSGLPGTPSFASMAEVLKTGAPLRFAGMELVSVNHKPIDPKRFELPAEPETLEQIRARTKSLALPPPPTAEPEKP
jgi:hypothetical protein